MAQLHRSGCTGTWPYRHCPRGTDPLPRATGPMAGAVAPGLDVLPFSRKCFPAPSLFGAVGFAVTPALPVWSLRSLPPTLLSAMTRLCTRFRLVGRAVHETVTLNFVAAVFVASLFTNDFAQLERLGMDATGLLSIHLMSHASGRLDRGPDPLSIRCLWNWGKLEGPRRERKVSILHLIGKQFQVVRDAVEFPIFMRNLHFVEDLVHVAVVLKPGILISDEHGNRNPAPDLRGIGAGQGPGVL